MHTDIRRPGRTQHPAERTRIWLGESAGAVQRYVNVTPEVTVDLDKVEIKTEGFIDYTYYMIRVMDGELLEAKGGKLTRLNGTLYLLEADKETVTIIRK